MSSGVIDDFESRAVQIEQRLAEQEQYTRLDCVDMVGLPKKLKGKNLEAVVLKVSREVGVPMEKHDFHARYRLYDTNVVIVNVCKCRDSITILRNKKKLPKLSQEGKKKSIVKKFT